MKRGFAASAPGPTWIRLAAHDPIGCDESGRRATAFLAIARGRRYMDDPGSRGGSQRVEITIE